MAAAHNRFQKPLWGAAGVSAGAGVELSTLTFEEAEEFDWEEFIQVSCQTGSGCYGTISWVYAGGGSELGFCDWCGSLHIRCGECGSVNWYNQEQTITCDGCEMRWDLHTEKGDVFGFEESPPEKDSEEEDEESEAD
jgi:hypothetical protein